ncbi:MAG: hypothetical protein AB7E51_12075 [Pseudodesulfovibrio sp.]|uniref:hypothetical protein n=1 Tax=Pseudodesulfovibrio sp. TaxID=2035812 RepID=UPI003D0D0FA7
MGSPSARLNVRENLRPWIESGLEFVYAPGGLAVEERDGDLTRSSASPAAYPVQPAAPSAPSAPGRPAPQAREPQVQARPAPTPRAQQVPSGANFPEPWNSFLRFTKPDARVVMTYMELGLDLGGQSDPRRRAVLKNLQAHLKWPPGTINFWPVAALVNGALQPDTALFWRGWELWHTPHVICFGDEALRVILPDADPGTTTHLLENVIVHKLPPIGQLVGLLPHEQQMAVDSVANIRL